MLVLSRQKNETIMIGDDVEITIVEIKGENVRVGISAPRSIPVHRKEVYLSIQQENLEAARLASDPAALPDLSAIAPPFAPSGSDAAAGKPDPAASEEREIEKD